jgi:fumarate hydratase subunit beta
MGRVHRLRLPLSQADVAALRIGDVVYLDGVITGSAGLPAYKRIIEFIDAGRPLPVDLQGGMLCHLGSYNRETAAGYECLYINPTTSTRFEGFMPKIIRALGVRAIGGKGGLGPGSVQAMQEQGCVYLSFMGGASALMSEAVRAVERVDWEDFIIQFRLTSLRIEGLGPLTVGIDAHGGSLYADLRDAADGRLPEIMARLNAGRRRFQGDPA